MDPPHHGQMARRAPRPAAAVFAAHAQRREGVDPAGRDGAAVRAAPGELRDQRPALARVPRAQPQQQDPRHPRPPRPRWPAAGAVRVRRHPGLPGREDRALSAAGRRRALRDAAVADVADGRRGADVWAARVLPQVRGQGLRGQAPAGPLRGRVQAPAGRAGATPDGPRLDHGQRLHHRRHRRVPLGAQPGGLLRRGRSGGL